MASLTTSADTFWGILLIQTTTGEKFILGLRGKREDKRGRRAREEEGKPGEAMPVHRGQESFTDGGRGTKRNMVSSLDICSGQLQQVMAKRHPYSNLTIT